MKKENFNVLIAGYGGQGILTIADIIAHAALKQGYDVKESEMHGLAQRGGSLECHVRFGRQIDSPIIPRGSADVIIALDALEALRACYWANKKTIILVNEKIFNSSIDVQKIISEMKKFARVYSVDADAIVEKETGDIFSVNIFMLGYAVKHGLLPFSREKVWSAIQEKIRKNLLEGNKKVFDRAFS